MHCRSLIVFSVMALAACTPSSGNQVQAEAQAVGEQANAFAEYQSRMQARRYLRTDWDPADAPFSNAELAENFHKIAFFAFPNDQFHIPKPLTRWRSPVKYAVLGNAQDQEQVAELMLRIARLTGLDIQRTSERDANFTVMLLDERERQTTQGAFADAGGRAFFDSFMSAIHDCGAIVNWTDAEPEISQAMVFLHGELGGLYRELCLHEEVSQSFGLFNDDPTVRPSIFNDDEEFALLTRHDEYLLRILYDSRLRPGMSAQQAMPLVHEIIEEIRPGK